MRHGLIAVLLLLVPELGRAQLADKVVRGDMVLLIPVRGKVEPDEIVRVRSPIDGRVEIVRSSPNTWIRTEDPLGFMASSELAALLDSNHTTPEETLQERWKGVFPLNPLRCPQDCYVLQVQAKPKTWAHSGEVLFKAARVLRLAGRFEGEVPAGQQAWPNFEIWATADPAHRLRVDIERISDKSVSALLPFGSKLTPGTAWEGELEVHVKRNVLKVPASALIRFKGSSYLAVKVVEGISVSHETEIQQGVHEGEELLNLHPDKWALDLRRKPIPPAPKPKPSADPKLVPPKDDSGIYALPTSPRAEDEELEETGPVSEANFFIHFQFLGVEPEFFALQSNDKVVARQQFLSDFDRIHKQLTMLTYSLSGIRADSDMLLVRVTENLEILQATFERLRAHGLGKYLNPAYTYLTTAESRPISLGRSQYLFVCPWGRTREWYALNTQQRDQRLDQELRIVMRKPSLTLYTFDSFGLEGQETILACETNQPRDFLGIVKELKGNYFQPVASTFLCTRKDIRDLVETVG